MFAVIKTGGKQYRVTPGDVIEVEKLENTVGDKVTFGSVLMHGEGASVTVGAPVVNGAEVIGNVLAQFRGEKVVGMKKRRRKHSSARRWGHRQYLTAVQIESIPGASASADELEAGKEQVSKLVARAARLDAEEAGEPAPKAAPSAPKAKRAAKPKPAPKPKAPKPAKAAPAKAAEPAKAPEPAKAAEPAKASEPAKAAPSPAPAAPAGADDLTKLPGITPEIAAKLRDEGVTTFKQITIFRLADWEKFEAAIGHDDFSRTSILTQAKKLVERADAEKSEG